MEKNRISYHESGLQMYNHLQEDGMSNVWDRYEAQGFGNPDSRCAFCMSGARCDLCSNGPCRADAAKDKRGVCGISADAMVMRMMLLRNVLGTNTYHYHTDKTVQTLRETALGNTSFGIKSPDKLRTFAVRLGLSPDGTDEEVALSICDMVEKDFCRQVTEPSEIVRRLAPKERQETWAKLGISPGGCLPERCRA